MTDSKPKTSSSRQSHSKKFLARKVHKLKKMLKLAKTRKFEQFPTSTDHPISLEDMQNMRNELICNENLENEQNEFLENYYKTPAEYSGSESDEELENAENEYWENWDDYCPCAVANVFWHRNYRHEERSICFVFMPNQSQPVPVKLRSMKVPGGFMWVSYGVTDVDFYSDSNEARCVTSMQTAQQQYAPIVV